MGWKYVGIISMSLGSRLSSQNQSFNFRHHFIHSSGSSSNTFFLMVAHIDSTLCVLASDGGELKEIHVFLEIAANVACNLTGSRKSLA